MKSFKKKETESLEVGVENLKLEKNRNLFSKLFKGFVSGKG